ncbi:MAG: YcaO-like family protein [Patescibacteria group bacterium]
MESEQDFGPYLPWEARLERASAMFSKESSVKFRSDSMDGMFESLSRTLLARVESVYGPLYAYSAGTGPYEWQKVLNILFEKKCVKAPRVYFAPPFNDEPKIIMASLASEIDAHALGGHPLAGMASFGASFDVKTAVSKAIGEFVERYSLLHWKNYPSVTASEAELRRRRKRFLSPGALAGAAGTHIDEHAPLQWVEGRGLFTGAKGLLPAGFVFWNYHPLPKEPSLVEANTNGAGGMFTLEGALLSGIRELIQRDAFLIFWLNTIAPPRVEQSSLEGNARVVADQLYRYRFDFEILDITTDLELPAFAAVLLDGEHESRGAYIGAGCEGNPEAAIARALEEALLVYHNARRGTHGVSLPEPYIPFTTPLGHHERIQLWANPAMFPRFKWFIGGKKISFGDIKNRCRAFASPAEEYAFIVHELKKRGPGYEVYYYAAPHPILKELGYHAVKVIIPDLIPLYLRETRANLNGRRLREVPQRLGYNEAAFPNPLPHPFP